jgi:hypothetical protein
MLQTRLNSKPPTSLPLLASDGNFGSKTLARVKEFQKNNALKADGIVGPMTWGKLLAGPTTPKTSVRFCDDGQIFNPPVTTGNQSSFANASFETASFVPGISLPSLPSLPTLRSLTAVEIAMATGVFGSSIDFSLVSLSDKTGASNRAFVVAVPNPFGKARQIMNVGTAPTRNTLIHELTHVWQSQHHSNSSQFMVNAIASQALEAATNLALNSTSFSAYGYVPGKPFGEYGAEQIAQQVMRGEAAIVAHVASVSVGAVDADNVTSLKTPRIEDTSLPGVKT